MMLRLSTLIALLASLVSNAACGRGQAQPNRDQRENAYRANNRGVALLEQFKYPEAVSAFKEAVGIDASLSIAHINLSLASLYAGNLEAAKREATEAARLAPTAPQPPYILGLIARAENRNADAVELFARVQQIDAHDAGTNTNLGQIYLQDRRYAEAITVLRRAAADEPYNVTATYSLGLALTRSGETEEGQRRLAESQALRSTGYGVTYGNMYLEQGRYAEALASTGAEPDLVDASVPPVTFTPTAIASPSATPSAVPAPFGRTFAAADLTPEGARALADSLGGALALIDFDRDGKLDLFVASAGGQRLFHNDGGRWSDVTATAGIANAPANTAPVGAVAGDYDNDGFPDLYVLRYGGSSLYRNDGHGRFIDATAAARLPAYPFLPGAAAFVDVDHDGDLDLVVGGLADIAATHDRADRQVIFPRDFVPAPMVLLRNNGDGTFTDITSQARVGVRAHAIAIVPTDFDNRRDIDLLIVSRDQPPILFKNLRDGTFRDVAADVGLGTLNGSSDEISAVAVADVNKDDFPDFFFARAMNGVFALSDSRGQFTIANAPEGSRSAVAALFTDYDNDGLFDLMTWSTDGPHVFRNLGRQRGGAGGSPQWSDVTARAMAPADRQRTIPSARALAAADVTGDRHTDVVAGDSGTLTLWRNSGDSHHQSLRVQLKGLVSNRMGIGSKVQLRAGSLSARVETSATTPAVAPLDIVFGLGSRSAADVVRALWPSGILQAETERLTSPLTIEELNRKPSSCPFLFTWNGERFEFVTDFIGGGEMGYWEGPGERNRPDPVEYVRIRDDQLRAKDGRFELRVTNELEETLFLDRLQLLVIAHPRGTEVLPNEGMTDPPKPFKLFAVAGEHAPLRAFDDHGHDVTDRIARLDRRYPDDFALAPFRGYAAQHTLTIDLGSTGFKTRSTSSTFSTSQSLMSTSRSHILLLTGWTDYAFSSDNVAAHQAGLSLKPPSLQVRDSAGRWRPAIADIGIPVGRPQTIAVDLADHLRAGEHEVRLVTNMRIYWDRIAIAQRAGDDRLPIVRLDPRAATLMARGFSAEIRPDGNDPPSYDYNRVAARSSWKEMPGRYTREGDVRELVLDADDMFVIGRPGDEIAVDFDASSVAPLPAGWTRTFLLLADGFSKEMDINSASPDQVAPLPFHRMTKYPYPTTEHYPESIDHQRYRERYNTRVIYRSVPRM